MTRACPYPALRYSHARVYVLHLNVASGATEEVASETVSQLFKVACVSVQHTGAIGDAIDVLVAFDQDSPVTGATGDPSRRPLWAPTAEGLDGQEVRGAHLDHPIFSGQVERRVPGRLILVAKNGTAGAVHVTALVTTDFLAPTESDCY